MPPLNYIGKGLKNESIYLFFGVLMEDYFLHANFSDFSIFKRTKILPTQLNIRGFWPKLSDFKQKQATNHYKPGTISTCNADLSWPLTIVFEKVASFAIL